MRAIDLAVRRTDDKERRLEFGPADRKRLPEVRCERRLDLRHDCGDRRGHCRWKLRERMHKSVMRWGGGGSARRREGLSYRRHEQRLQRLPQGEDRQGA